MSTDTQQALLRTEEEATDKYIQDRLIYKDHSLKGLIRKYFDFLNSDHDNNEQKHDLLQDLSLYDFQIAVASRSVQTQYTDRQNLAILHDNIQKKIKISQTEIVDLKKNYEGEEQIKNNKMTYENLSQQINQYDDQNEIAKKIDIILNEIKEMKQSHSSKMRKIKEKEKHLALLLCTMKELTNDN